VAFQAGTNLWRGQRSGGGATGSSRQSGGTEDQCGRPAGFLANLPAGNHLLDPLAHLRPLLDSLQTAPKKVLELVAQDGPRVAPQRTIELSSQPTRKTIDETAEMGVRILAEDFLGF